jgi:hypothetical protein
VWWQTKGDNTSMDQVTIKNAAIIGEMVEKRARDSIIKITLT